MSASETESDLPFERTTQRRGQRLTDHVLNSAFKLVSERGYADLTVDAIAEHAGVSKASIYSRWPNKHALIAEALSQRVPYVEIPDLGSFEAEVKYLLMERLREYGTPEAAGRVGAMLASAAEDETGGKVLAAEVVHKQTALDEVIQRAIDRGEVDPRVNRESLKHLIPAALVFRTLFVRTSPTEEFVAHVASIIAHGAATWRDDLP